MLFVGELVISSGLPPRTRLHMLGRCCMRDLTGRISSDLSLGKCICTSSTSNSFSESCQVGDKKETKHKNLCKSYTRLRAISMQGKVKWWRSFAGYAVDDTSQRRLIKI